MNDVIGHSIERLVRTANFSLRSDVKKAIETAYRNEKEKSPKQALEWILKNAEAAKKNNLAICQDTGFPIVFIKAGKDVELTSSLVFKIKKAVACSYKNNYLRKSIVFPFGQKASSYQGGETYVEFFSRQKGLRVTLFPKGFGSENKSRLKLFKPTASMQEIEDFVVKSVELAGSESCPPFFLGIGIGGTSDSVLCLAKKSLLDKIGSPNPDKTLQVLEKRILKKVNQLKIGPMGLGGKFTALGVRVRRQPTHIAGLPVGVNISCHALRSATVQIKVRN